MNAALSEPLKRKAFLYKKIATSLSSEAGLSGPADLSAALTAQAPCPCGRQDPDKSRPTGKPAGRSAGIVCDPA